MSAPQKSKHALKNPFFAPMTAAMMTSTTTAMSNIHPNKNTLLFPARLPRALCDTVIIPHYSVCDNVLSVSITLRFSFRISRTPSRYTVLSSAMAMLFVSAGTLQAASCRPVVRSVDTTELESSAATLLPAAESHTARPERSLSTGSALSRKMSSVLSPP